MSNVSLDLGTELLVQSAASGDTAIDYSSEQFRRIFGTIWNKAGTLQPGEFEIQQRAAGANWSIDITSGRAVIEGATSREKYIAYLASTLNVPITGINTSPAATRTHKVYLVAQDKNYSGTTYGPRIFIGEDTGSGAPTPDGLPVGYLQLGQFTISPSQGSIQTAHISNATVRAGFDATWTNLTLSAGFVDGSSGVHVPQYRKFGSTVELRGLVGRTAAATFTATDHGLLTMPEGARPAGTRTIYFAVATSQPHANDQAVARVSVAYTGGLVASVGDYPGSATQPSWVSLDGIRYDTT